MTPGNGFRQIVLPLAGFLVLLGLLLACPALLDALHVEQASSRREKRFAQVLAEGAVLNKHGVYGVDFIRCRRCSVEKLRKGPLTFGGLNALLLEDLRVVLPPSTNETATVAEPEAATPREIAGRMGLDDGFLKSQGATMKFSALRIDGLAVLLLRGGKVAPAFTASCGDAKPDGLHLRDCVIMKQTVTNRVSRALLKVKPSLRLEWAEGAWDLN